MRALAISIFLSTALAVLAFSFHARYEIHVASNTTAAWIFDKRSGVLTYCDPAIVPMSSYLSQLKQNNSRVSEFYNDTEILEYLPEFDPAMFSDMSKSEINQFARTINPCRASN